MASTFVNIPPIKVDGDITVALSSVSDSVSIGSGPNSLYINPDGSLNVNIGGNGENHFNEIHSVSSSGDFTTVLSYAAPAFAKLKIASVSGANVAEYDVTVNSEVQSKRYTSYAQLNADFDFKDGIELGPGDMVLVRVRHSRPSVADFSANIIVQI